jgi:hypothetical protein
MRRVLCLSVILVLAAGMLLAVDRNLIISATIDQKANYHIVFREIITSKDSRTGLTFIMRRLNCISDRAKRTLKAVASPISCPAPANYRIGSIPSLWPIALSRPT